MRVLLLSANTGEGHNSCAKAIKEVFDLKSEVCTLEDGLRFISDGTSRFLSWGHTFVYRNLPWLFSFGYDLAERHASSFSENSALYNFFAKGSERLCEYIIREKYDTVIATHPFTALMLTDMQKKYFLPIKTAFVATDYTCSPSVKDGELDIYFIPDEKLKDDFLCPHIPKEKMIVSGIPIRQMFYRSAEKTVAKESLGIPTGHRHIVMMCGSMGCGPIARLTDILTEKLQDNCTLTVVCGTNEKLRTQLERKYGDRKNLQIKGFVEDMSQLLDSADLYLTKAGGISVSEASVKKLPMVFINAVAGCEDYNSSFFGEYGCCLKGNTAKEIADMTVKLLEDEPRYNRMLISISKKEFVNAGECIYNCLSDSQHKGREIDYAKTDC